MQKQITIPFFRTSHNGNTFFFVSSGCPFVKLPKDVDTSVIFTQKEQDGEVELQFINQDGSEAELCGNAIFAFVRQSDQDKFTFYTKAGIILAEKTSDLLNMMKIDMPQATIDANVNYPKHSDLKCKVNIGNPHIVIITAVDAITHNKTKILELHHDSNVHFVRQLRKNVYSVRCFERGVGETQACGSGAYAVGIAMAKNEHHIVTVQMKGGDYIVKNGCLYANK